MQKIDFNNPVSRLTGNEFLPKPGLTFAQQILEYFQSFGGKANSPWGEAMAIVSSRDIPDRKNPGDCCI